MSFARTVTIPVLAAAGVVAAACGSDGTNATVDVKLDNYTVQPSKPAVPTGKVTFKATNAHPTDVHELAVLQVRADGSLKNMGEVEDLAAGKSGDITISLPKGNYILACLIAAGQEGSKVDHYAQGMKTDFRVD